jgi:hypothetical protein
VGTSFDEATLRDLLRLLEPLRRATSPLDEPVPRGGGSSRTGGASVWVEPKVVVEVKFSERTADGRLRHPVFVRVRDDEYFVRNNTATLIWLAQLGNLELHVAHTRIVSEPGAPHLATDFVGSVEHVECSTLNYPDFLVVDLGRHPRRRSRPPPPPRPVEHPITRWEY